MQEERGRKKICVVTATRAEYGLLFHVIERIEKDAELDLCLVATGTHLSAAYGNTVREIEESGIKITEKIPILDEDDGPMGICRTMGRAAVLFGEMYGRQKPDMLVVLGDRYELLPICSSALQFQIPIAHISGGEVTAGALDDIYRHCITKMSHLHFPGCKDYRRRIIQLGEDPGRVFDYGDVGVENTIKMDLMEKEELEESIGFTLDKPYGCVTFHPPTMEGEGAIAQFQELMEALEAFEDMKFILTKANADSGGRKINEILDEYAAKHENWICFSSMGIRRYLSALKYCDMVIGNSSSGIVEAPCFHVPTINIGSRQDGRLQAESILNCEPRKEAIIAAMHHVKSQEFQEQAKRAENPYGKGETSLHIVEEIKNYLKNPVFQKKFYDIDFMI